MGNFMIVGEYVEGLGGVPEGKTITYCMYRNNNI